ncbi:hypothetical protein EYE40_07830 [Glaciihabitans arcticus]|uniref:TOMM leader peptide-binding protein n=1 Tax=Glaciihabitans arcticus TaxID=2668039 RepID=A0A4Q9GR00_9MICO|nr:hypothetical protein [Glaciihabitans arcticus]TBN57312.1 hypothetical protein EYE40_07830 [Glaciihabitans arcticus]
MFAMVLALDSRYPLVWRTPSSLQLGVSTPRAVFENVDLATERMLDALVGGVSSSGLMMIGTSARASEAEVAAFLQRVRPALRTPTLPRGRPDVLVVGRGHTAARIAAGIAATGARVVESSARTPETRIRYALVVLVSCFVVEPSLHGLWLRRDIPHLPVVLSDTTVEIGPTVEPGSGPCLYCLLRTRTDADAAWPAIAAQLWGRRSALDTPLVAGEVAAIVTRIAAARLRRPDAVEPVHTQLELDPATGAVRRSIRQRHPECECADLQIVQEAGALAPTGALARAAARL